MAVFDNLNYTSSSGVSASVVQYYDRKLLEVARNKLVHLRDLQQRNIPRHNGRTVQFRKMTPFDPITTPLQEGVTPTGQTVAMTSVTATVRQYGGHVEMTDEMDWALLDNIHRETAALLAQQAEESLDSIGANALNSGSNVLYVDASTGTNASRSLITAADILTPDAIKKAVRILERNKAKKFPDGTYHAIIDADTKYDLTGAGLLTNIATYQDQSLVRSYQMPDVYGVRFFETEMSKTFPSGEYLYATTTNYAIASGTAATLKATMAASTVSATATTVVDFVRAMAGKDIQIYDASETTYFPAVIDRIESDGTTLTIYFRWMGSSDWEYADGDKIYAAGAGASDYEVHSTIVYGQNCGGTVKLDGEGGIQSIIKPAGSSGALDPLNQRGTLAWKAPAFCATLLQDGYIVRIEHGVSA